MISPRHRRARSRESARALSILPRLLQFRGLGPLPSRAGPAVIVKTSVYGARVSVFLQTRMLSGSVAWSESEGTFNTGSLTFPHHSAGKHRSEGIGEWTAPPTVSEKEVEHPPIPATTGSSVFLCFHVGRYTRIRLPVLTGFCVVISM
jgi:hypothetical protein